MLKRMNKSQIIDLIAFHKTLLNWDCNIHLVLKYSYLFDFDYLMFSIWILMCLDHLNFNILIQVLDFQYLNILIFSTCI